jgi:hypothetical protein
LTVYGIIAVISVQQKRVKLIFSSVNAGQSQVILKVFRPDAATTDNANPRWLALTQPKKNKAMDMVPCIPRPS